MVDLGSGPGYYLEAVLEALPERIGIAVDNSKYAARRAARCHPRAGAVVADVWQDLPLASESAAVIINVFAPRNGEEIERVLAPGGLLLTVTPDPDHLHQLAGPLSMISVDSDKERRLRQTLGPLAEDMESKPLSWQMQPEPERGCRPGRDGTQCRKTRPRATRSRPGRTGLPEGGHRFGQPVARAQAGLSTSGAPWQRSAATG